MVLVLYIAVNFALVRHIPIQELASEKAVMELLARNLFGVGASGIFSGLVAFALLSSLGVSAFLGPRVLQAMLGWYRSNSNGAESPRPLLIWLQAGLSMFMIISGTFEQILMVAGFLLGVFPILAVLGLYTRTANEPEPVPPFARFVAVPIFLIGSSAILILGAWEKPREMAVALVILLVIYALRQRIAGKTTSKYSWK